MNNTPDLGDINTIGNYRRLYSRESFRVGFKVFRKVEPGFYKCGNFEVFCDQQDSTSWCARIGAVRCGWYWAPEYAIEKVISSLEKLK